MSNRNTHQADNRVNGLITWADTFITAGAATDPTLVTTRDRDSISVIHVSDGALNGYRVRLRAGERRYQLQDQDVAITVAVKHGAGISYTVQGDRINDTANSLGLPGQPDRFGVKVAGVNEFDILLYTNAGANTQVAGVEISWSIQMENRTI